MKNKKSKTQHAKFSPSKAKIWMNCAGAVQLCLPLKSEPSAYAEEGTLAHALLNLCLLRHELPDTYIGEDIDYVSNGEDKIGRITENTALAVRYAYDLIRAQVKENPGAICYSERKLVIFDDVNGTVDATIILIFSNVLKIYDYKHGQGVYVSAVENEQMMLYAYGVIQDLKLEGIEIIEMTIIQPRGNWTNKHNSWACTRAELEAFIALAKVAKAKAEKIKKVTEADLCDGDWCKEGFCEARKQQVCPLLRTRLKEGLQIVGASALVSTPDVSKLGAKELARVKDVEKIVIDFFKSCNERSLELAEAGEVIPGWGLTEDYGDRCWISQDAAAAALSDLGEALYKTERKFLSPAQVEKIKGFDKTRLKDLVERPNKGFKLKKV